VWCVDPKGKFAEGELAYSMAPVRLPGITNAKRVAVGEHHACALLDDGKVMCWGEGDKNMGRAPDTLTSSTEPIRIALGPR
jgi:alpha-tubulin suppressor-like RCC1 family protein